MHKYSEDVVDWFARYDTRASEWKVNLNELPNDSGLSVRELFPSAFEG